MKHINTLMSPTQYANLQKLLCGAMDMAINSKKGLNPPSTYILTEEEIEDLMNSLN